jgi:cytochrome c-type biogenesis protein CcmH/NrfG
MRTPAAAAAMSSHPAEVLAGWRRLVRSNPAAVTVSAALQAEKASASQARCVSRCSSAS